MGTIGICSRCGLACLFTDSKQNNSHSMRRICKSCASDKTTMPPSLKQKVDFFGDGQVVIWKPRILKTLRLTYQNQLVEIIESERE